MPAHSLFRQLLQQTNLPLAAPSANPFGYVSPTTAEHVQDGLGSKIRYILDGGPSSIGLESTIVDLRNPRSPRLLRPGAITAEQIERVLQRPLKTRRPQPKANAQLAPGLMARHYSPRTPALLHRKLPSPPTAAARPDEAWIYFARPDSLPDNVTNIFWLQEEGGLTGAARQLFAVLRRVDRKKFRCIHLERAPRGGLGDAINDRLQRAATR